MSSAVSFDDHVAIVTGAGGGLGRGYAKLLAARGARVVVNDLRNATAVVEEISSLGGKAVADEHDISTEEGARGVVRTAVEAFGALDAVVNNAGVFPACPFLEMTWEIFDLMQRVHTYGPYFTTRYAWPHLVESGHGRVVMVSAKATLWGETRHLTHYGAAKGAVLGMTRQLAMEGAEHGICVNAVLPSALTSVEHPRARELARRVGADPADREQVVERSTALAAAVVAWLCHPDCAANGEFIRAQVGEVRQVSFSMTHGINDPGLTVEAVRDGFDAILDPTGAAVLAPLWRNQAPL
ncbi:SDR family NAD(P)-dependent oxidoreductase [Frankia sp. CNm7]|uniref:SDR family NAD(P)-dependent oxidoreductase n=1 Tax=Frankia nepalensis TaxID=1836974 RepID=A0A937RNH6_9ACTN|nr:SDR family NAD(P)-dependent oxidoreductase [Frankia nepalensis]MBL7499152.1 SDR family NAD(P)-dependent oxidoreductase [Frankia nepalensis]MBL7511030.1 SDR family NAD(P)-dependent oxidoreductase [Frankia nepalensis]MBL7520502.1 SDR family NAD(P)-dependent oxidoreductase [Frankia nepalensis]MBL7632110.1 SDR family NAD(P)-dependent oxidoreductase [Frankia nepalensis]